MEVFGDVEMDVREVALHWKSTLEVEREYTGLDADYLPCLEPTVQDALLALSESLACAGMRMPLPVVQGVARYAVATFTSPHPLLRCAAIPRDHLTVLRGETVVVPHGYEPFVANSVSGWSLAHVAALCGNRR